MFEALRTDAAVLNSERFVFVGCGDLTTSVAGSGLDFLIVIGIGICSMIEIGLAPSGGNSQVFGTFGAPPRAGNSSVSSLKSFFLMTMAFGAFLAAAAERAFELNG